MIAGQHARHEAFHAPWRAPGIGSGHDRVLRTERRETSVNEHLERVVRVAREAAAAVLGEARREIAAVGRVIVERKIRLGVTGLSRAGKTVFVTSLIQNMRLAKRDKMRWEAFIRVAEGESR